MSKKHRARHVFRPANQLYAVTSAKTIPGRDGAVVLRRLPGLTIVASFESVHAAAQSIGAFKNIRARWGPRVEAYEVRGGSEALIGAADWAKLTSKRSDLARIAAVNAAIRARRGSDQGSASPKVTQVLGPGGPADLRASAPKQKPRPSAMMTRYIDQDVG